MKVCKLIIYANCDKATAIAIVKSAFDARGINVEGESEDLNAVAKLMGKRGGSSTSIRKSQAARRNGLRGGRPRKQNGV